MLAACGPRDEDNAVYCTDRADNDNDGLVDCMEPACAAFCGMDPEASIGPPAGDTGELGGGSTTDTVDTLDTVTDTGPPLVRLGGTVRFEDSWNPAGFEIELLGSGLPPAVTDGFGNWTVDVAAGTYPWRLTAPDVLPVPSTGTELTVRLPTGTTSSTTIDTGKGIEALDQAFDVLLPSFVADAPLPLQAGQLTTGLIVTVPELAPVAGQQPSDTIGAVLASTPVPIEGVQHVHLMYHLRPFGHLGIIDVDLIYPLDLDQELWGLDPVTGRWQSFGGFVDIGNNRISATQSVPWVTTLAVVTP